MEATSKELAKEKEFDEFNRSEGKTERLQADQARLEEQHRVYQGICNIPEKIFRFWDKKCRIITSVKK